jgi:hypothetical protein
VLREADLIVADVRERADAAAGKPSAAPAAAATAGHTDHAEELRDGHPVTVRLGQHALPIGDLGHPRVDARLLGLMLVGDTPVARLLRAHGIDEAAIDAALGSG